MTQTLEQEIAALRTEIASTQATAQEKRDAAHAEVKAMKAAGRNPLADAEAFAKIDAMFREGDELAEQAVAMTDRLNAATTGWARTATAETATVPGTITRTTGPVSAATMAGRFLASEPYGRVREMLTTDSGAIGNLGNIEVANRDETLGFLAAAGEYPHGDLVPEDQRLTPPIALPRRALRILDLITRLSTNSDVVEWAEQVAVANGTADITATETAAIGEKAYGTAAARRMYRWERRSEPVRRFAAETVGTRGNLADQAQLEGLLRTELTDEMTRLIESRLVNGTGSGDQVRGIRNTVGIGSLARNTGAGEPRIEALHRGITKVRIDLEDEPTAIGMHPTTDEQVLFEKDSEGRYRTHADPTRGESMTLWGLPKVVSTVFAVEEALIGRWSYARFWLREGLGINAFDQHEDFASKGLVLFVANTRAGFRVVQPKAFTVVTEL